MEADKSVAKYITLGFKLLSVSRGMKIFWMKGKKEEEVIYGNSWLPAVSLLFRESSKTLSVTVHLARCIILQLTPTTIKIFLNGKHSQQQFSNLHKRLSSRI